jgi:hypothetical protein
LYIGQTSKEEFCLRDTCYRVELSRYRFTI